MATFARSSPPTLAIKTDQPECFRCDTHAAGLLRRVQARRDLCDVALIAGAFGKRIYAHRLILMASSDYFSDLLSERKDDSKVWEITLNDMDGDILEKLVNFCYTGSLELRVDTIKTMLTTANYLQLNEITEGCCEFFLRHQQPSNYLAIAFFAEQQNLEALLHNVKKAICAHFEEVSKHPEFLLLNAKQMSEFIACDDLHVPSEEFVFHVLMKWIEFEPENRQKHFTELLAQVRLPLLSTEFLTAKVEPLCDTMESQMLVLNELKSRLLLTSNSTRPRKSSSKSVVNHLWAICAQKRTLAKKNLSIAGYDLRTKKWTICDTQIEFCPGFAVALMGEDVIVVGGSSNGSPMNTVTKLNIRTRVSSEMAPLRTSRKYHAVAVLKGAIYAIGGNTRYQDLNSVERYDPVNGTWVFIPVMKNARMCSAVVVVNDRLYVSGGLCSGESVTSMECYDPVENTWRSTAPMRMGRYLHSLATHKGYLFAIGGYSIVRYEGERPIYDHNISTERYDPLVDTWTLIASSPIMSSLTKCSSLGTEVFIYNNSKFYTISSEGSCDNLKLKTLNKPPDTFIGFDCKELVAIPFEVNPTGSSMRNAEF